MTGSIHAFAGYGIAALLCALPAAGANLTGRLIDIEGKPVAGVAVALEKGSATAITDGLGKFNLTTVSIRPGYRSVPGAAMPQDFPTPAFPGNGDLRSLLGRRLEGPAAVSPYRHVATEKQAAAADTLALSKSAYLTRRLAIANPDSGLGDIILHPALPGAAVKYLGYDQFNFTVAGKAALVVAPKKPRSGNPWIWRTYFWNHKPLFDSILCAQGYYLAFIDAPNLFGAPAAVAIMDSFYVRLTGRYGLSRKPTLFGISRGAYYMYNWGRANTDKISALYGDGAGMDYVSWPCGCYGTGTGSAGDWTLLKSVFGFTDDAAAKAYRGNPYQNMKPFALAKTPIIHVYGETDNVAPPNENVLKANDSLKAYGWKMTLLAKPKTGHTHGVTAGDGGLPGQLDSLVAFVLRNTAP